MALVAALAAPACAGGAPGAPARGRSEGPPRTAASAASAPAVAPEGVLPGRAPLGTPVAVPLEAWLEPIQGGRSLLAVSSHAGDPVTAWRRLDAAGAAPSWGPVVRVTGERLAAAFDGQDGRYTVVTSDGARVCIATYGAGAAEPDARGCAEIEPAAIAWTGERIALVETNVERPPEPPAASAPPKPKATKPKAKPKPKGTPKLRHRPAKKKKKASASSPPRPPAPKAKVDVRVRWATRDGRIDDAAASTGLRFERPQEGMTIIDAVGRAGGVDLLWYEWGSRKKKDAPLGTARIATGSLRADGSFDPSTRRTIVEDDLAWGSIDGHKWPRLVGTGSATAFVDIAGKGGGCQAAKIAPAASPLAPGGAACAADPARIAAADPVAAAEAAALEQLLADEPRRVPGQIKNDPGLVAWAGDRAYYWKGGALRSAARADGAPRDEPAPLVAQRAPIAWGALSADGEGVALAGGSFYRLDAVGRVAELGPVPAGAPRALIEPEIPGVDRRRAAKIGDVWWAARGDVVRVPDGRRAPGLEGRAHPDATALVGGRERGLLLEVRGPSLLATALDAEGATLALPNAAAPHPSPVRAGFDAVERRAGGAIVAGVSAADPTRVVVFVVGSGGELGPVRDTSLAVRAGELAVRLVALPGGGAVLSDRERRRAVWLDDDGRELGRAAWPEQVADESCIDGAPAHGAVPGPEPGRFVRVDGLAERGTCVVGDAVLAGDGTARWFGSRVRGIDARAEVAVLAVLPPIETAKSAADPASAATPASARAGAASTDPPACPADMVSVARAFCIDRYESTLLDAESGQPIAPDWSATPSFLDLALGEWSTGRFRVGGVHARAFPLPELPAWMRGARPSPVAQSRAGVQPSGYVTGVTAAAACAAAGKRLCSVEEFTMACRGEDDTLFPYGDDYVDGACNVFREDHPAAMLHGNASIGHLDPRLDRVAARGGPLLRATGATPECRSRWGSDAVYDLVGNIDEWVDEPGGGFAGGFYSRSTRAGCEALITAHPRPYLDYSTGVRCCSDAAGKVAAGGD